MTREVMQESALLRFVRGPDGQVVPDLQRKLPGRGLWVGVSRPLLQEAVKRRLFSRGFGAETQADDNLPDMVAGLLRKQALSYVSLAKKAGVAVAGAMKVEEMVRQKKARLVLHAAEAADDGMRKIDNLATPFVKVTKIFKVDELDLAFGRVNVIHAAIGYSQLADKLVLALQRIEMYDAQKT